MQSISEIKNVLNTVSPSLSPLEACVLGYCTGFHGNLTPSSVTSSPFIVT